jgi:hypothetical protein
MMIFKVIGKLDEMPYERYFDCPKELEIAMKDVDRYKELGVFKNGCLDVLARNELVRKYEWL